MIGRLILFLLLAVLLFPVHAAEVTYGFLKCVVMTDLGKPSASEKVVVTAADQKFNYTTDATGTFSAMVQSGEVTIQVLGLTKTVKVVEGESTTVQMTIIKPGLMLTVNNIVVDGIAYRFDSAYMLDGKTVNLNSFQFALGKYFFQVPENATDFSAIITVNNNGKYVLPGGFVHKAWKFAINEPRRDLVMDYLKPVTLSMKLYNENNSVVADGTKITGKLSWTKPLDRNFADWLKIDVTDSTRPVSIYENQDYIRINATVANGMITLPECMPGMTYSVQMTIDGGMRGGPMQVLIDENGKANVNNYKFIPRKIIQTVFDNSGQPAANTEVNASYTLNGKINIITAKTDDKGMVTWTGFPDNRATVWGDNIPAGVISAEAVTITTPLKPLQLNTNFFSISIKSPESTATGCSYYVNEDNQLVSFGVNIYSVSNYSSINGKYNLPITLYLMTNEETPRYKILKMYVPYNDYPVYDATGNTAILEITGYKPANKQHIKIVNADKTTPALFNNVKFYPEELIKTGCGFYSALSKTKAAGDGVDLWYVYSGNYRVCVDLIESLDSPVAVINLPDKKDTTIVMPEITGTVPGGSIVSWVGIDEPTETHVMRYLANSKDMPVYADKSSILAWWCKTSPKNMRVWRNGKLTDLSLRSFNVKLVDENGKPVATKDRFNNNHLSTLFPPFKYYDEPSVDAVPSLTDAIGNSEYTDIWLVNKATVNLWTTKYALNMVNRTLPSSIMNITKDTPEEIILTKKTIKKDDPALTKVELKFNSADNTTNNLRNDIKIIFDKDENSVQIFNIQNPPFYCTVPENARTMTIISPWVGILKDKPVEIKDNKIIIDLDKFASLKTLKGKLYNSKGKIFKDVNIYLRCIDLADINCTAVRTAVSDIDGNYSFTNIPSGTYQLIYSNQLMYRNPYNKKSEYSVVKIAEDTPVTVFDINLTDNNPDGYRDSNLLTAYSRYMNNYAWWIFDNGDAVMPMPTGNNVLFPLPDAQKGKGCLYFLSTSSARNGAAVFADTRWSCKESNAFTYKALADLYIIADMPGNLNYPSVISISGTGPWEGITYRQLLQWNTYTGMEAIVSKISGLPPGKWKIKLIGEKTIEKEIIMKDDPQTIRVEL